MDVEFVKHASNLKTHDSRIFSSDVTSAVVAVRFPKQFLSVYDNLSLSVNVDFLPLFLFADIVFP
jgi:hypothetical protein